MEAVDAGYDEAIMLNHDGVISEGSGENLFIVRDGVVYTPPIAVGCLDGLTRNAVSTLLSEEGYEIVERTLDRSDLYYADEIFLTGTAAEVTPVREVDDRAVADGIPGPVTRLAQGLYADLVSGKLDKHRDWLEFI
jgi:branched-chain amino acid aminotransferase